MMFTTKKRLVRDLHIFLGIVITLIIIGILFIYSSSSVYALAQSGSSSYYVQKQCYGILLGIICACIARFIPLNIVEIFTPLFFWGSWLLTASILVFPQFSMHIHGSTRWLHIGSFGFQPSELLKIAFILFAARFLTKREGKVLPFKSYIPFFIVMGLVSVILLQQPDFGLTITLMATALMLLFIADFPIKYLLISLCSLLPIGVILIYKNPYRLRRILTFLNPWEDPKGAGFQIIQSLIAIGSGKWFGTGISHSKQKFFYLPMQHTDFIFSIIAEETGFVGATVLILLYLFFCYFGLRIAWQLKNTFHAFVTVGFVLLLSLQTLINLFVTTGLLPTKGIGLPFVSYGNSGLVCSLFMLGLITNMVKNAH